MRVSLVSLLRVLVPSGPIKSLVYSHSWGSGQQNASSSLRSYTRVLATPLHNRFLTRQTCPSLMSRLLYHISVLCKARTVFCFFFCGSIDMLGCALGKLFMVYGLLFTPAHNRKQAKQCTSTVWSVIHTCSQQETGKAVYFNSMVCYSHLLTTGNRQSSVLQQYGLLFTPAHNRKQAKQCTSTVWYVIHTCSQQETGKAVYFNSMVCYSHLLTTGNRQSSVLQQYGLLFTPAHNRKQAKQCTSTVWSVIHTCSQQETGKAVYFNSI